MTIVKPDGSPALPASLAPLPPLTARQELAAAMGRQAVIAMDIEAGVASASAIAVEEAASQQVVDLTSALHPDPAVAFRIHRETRLAMAAWLTHCEAAYLAL